MITRAAREDAAARPVRGLRARLRLAPAVPPPVPAAPAAWGTPSVCDAIASEASALVHRLRLLARSVRDGETLAPEALERCAADAATLSRRAERASPAGIDPAGLRQVQAAREDVRSSVLLVAELFDAAARI